MVKGTLKRTLSLLLALLMVFSVFTMTSWAANVTTGVPGLTADSSGSATWTGENGQVSGSVKASVSSGCAGTTYTAQTGKLTYTNNSGSTALLSFDFTVVTNGGDVKIDGSSMTAGGSFSKKLEVGGTAAVEITSNASDDNSTQIEMTNLKLTPEQEVTVTFKAPENGSYTVDGAAITADTPITKLTTDSFELAATAASGYKFFGWYSETEDEYFATNASVTRSFTSDQTVYPVFVSSSSPVFQVGSKLFYDLNDAISYSQSSGTAKITLISNGTLPAGNYTIPNGKTLLIPFDEAQTVYTTSPGLTTGSDGKPAAHVDPSAFRTLTMASGATLTVASGGVLSVPSMLSAVGTNSGSWNATPTGKHGRITMNAGSSIDVQSGGKLYVYGYISGSGSVYARSGAEVWECFQIRCWRGGTATSGMADNSQKVFPLNQYYVQNIEAPLTIYPGATEKVFAAVNMSSQQFGASATFIGNGGMFTISNGSVTKRFTGASDRLELNVDGDFSITPMSLKITGLPLVGTLDLNTADYVLPINSNITINVDAGTTTISQDVAFFPGTEMTIAAGAVAEIANGHKAYVYDQDQWGAYAAGSAQLVVVGYSTVNGTTAKRTAASLVDSKIDVNGTLKVSGTLYTTQSGAAIVSSAGTGKVVMQANAGTETKTYQATQSGSDITYVEIPITAAKLQHADGTYYETAGKPAGTEIPYSNGFWGDPPVPTYTVKFWLNAEAEAPLKTYVLEEGTQPIYDGETPVKEADLYYSYEFDGWQLEGSGEVYTAETLPVATADASYYAHFAAEPRKYDVTWKVDGQEDLVEQYEYSEVPTYPYHIPEKASDENYTYSFAGWKDEAGTVYGMNDALPPVTGDAVYTAVFTPSLVNGYYLIGLHGWDAADLLPEDKLYENQANASEMMLEHVTLQAGDEFKVVYLNNGELTWYPENAGNYVVDAGHAGEDKLVIFNPKGTGSGDGWHAGYLFVPLNEYTVTWKDWDGRELRTERYYHGEIPSYLNADVTENPSRQEDEAYVYSFDGWNDGTQVYSGTLPAVTADVVYTAHFAASPRMYDILWIVGEEEIHSEWAYGATPVYMVNGEPATPTKAPDAEFTYTFDHWEPEIVPVEGDATYVANFIKTKNTYTITWIVDGVETQETYEYGDYPVYKVNGEPADPTKEADAQYSYSFAGWTPEIGEVTRDATYTARFDQTVNKYRVHFLNENGEELWFDDFEYGTVPVYGGDAFDKPDTDQYSYSFLGWSDETEVYTGALPAVHGEVSYTAVFTETLRSYTITWIIDGNEETEEYPYGKTPSHADPYKAPDAQYSYTFTGWDPEIQPVTGPATYTAQFENTLRSYTITFNNYDGSLLWSTELAYGSTPVYNGPDPVRSDDAHYSYTFIGWDPELAEVKGPAVYVAQYRAELLIPNGYYLVGSFNDWEPSAQYLFTQSGDRYVLENVQLAVNDEMKAVRYEEGEALDWYPDGGAGTNYVVPEGREGSKTVWFSPDYLEEFFQDGGCGYLHVPLNLFTVTWNNDDGTQLELDENVPYGTMPSYDGQTPSKAPDAQFTYTFDAWSPEPSTVTGNMTYTATYTKTVNTYTIIWKNEDGTVLETDENVPYGTVPNYDGDTPVKAGDAEFSYEFAGWNPSVAEVTGDAVYTATYTESTNSYTVTWNNYDGTELEVDENVPYGAEPSYDGEEPVKPSDEQYEYVFAGWTPAVSAVTGNVTYTATFTSQLRSYTVTFVNYNGQVLYSSNFEYGTVPEYVGDEPVKEGDAQFSYTFAGWTPAIVAVHGDATYTATYEQVTNEYRIRFVNEDGTELYSAMVAYGDTPVYGGETPTKTNTAQYTYTFAGWDPEIVTVTGEATYKAVFDAEVNKYLIRFVNDNGDLLYSAMFAYGETPVYDGDTPAKEGNAQYSYTFTGWDPEIEAVTGEATYTATFEESVNRYLITFVNEDGTELYSASFAYGERPVYDGQEPAKQAGENETGAYRFIGWEPEITEVTGDKTYTAKFSYTGFRSDEQGLRYYVDDEMQTGLVLADGETYYMDPDTGYAVTGLVRLVLENGEVNYYYFTENYQAVKDGTYKVDNNNGLPLPCFNYNFDANGVIEHDPDTSKNGISVPSDDPNGLFYMIDGIKVGMGLLRIDGSYYYARTSSGEIVRGRTYYVSVTNGLPIQPGQYSFDAEGRMILNGFFQDGSSTYYYQDGVMAKGFTKIGEDYYFFNAGSGKLYKDIRLWVPVNEYGVEPGYYYFGVDGKMELPAPKNGFVEEGGYSYYYVNGERAKGFTKIGEDYYFFNAGNGRMYKNIKLWVPENEYGVEPGYYDFDAEGKMILPTVKNGFVEENGSVYYYINGEKAKGLMKIGEDFYFFNQSSGKMYKGMKLWVADHPEYGIVGGMYQFDEEGRMVLPG